MANALMQKFSKMPTYLGTMDQVRDEVDFDADVVPGTAVLADGNPIQLWARRILLEVRKSQIEWVH